MKIRVIAVYKVVNPYSGGIYHLSGNRTYSEFDSTFVRIETDSGLVGWGECSPFGSNFVAAHARGVRAGIEELAPYLLGQNPLEIDRINDLMDGELTGHPHAKSPLDMACWDILGKFTGLPVYVLLGGSSGRPVRIISSIPNAEPETMVANVTRMRGLGYKSHSCKVGHSFDRDVACIEAVMQHAEAGETYQFDVNCGWTIGQATRVSDTVKATGFYFEQPCATLRECYDFKRRTGKPLMIDECVADVETLLDIIANDGADGINLKIGKVGGLTKARRIRDLCTAAGLSLSIQDSAGSCIAFSAITHLAQSTSPRVLIDALDTRNMMTLETADGVPEVVDGMFTATTASGLGVTPKLDVLGSPIAVYGKE